MRRVIVAKQRGILP
jgi:hypothetical protein